MPGAGFVLKELTPLLGLFITTGVVIWVNKRIKSRTTNDTLLDQKQLQQQLFSYSPHTQRTLNLKVALATLSTILLFLILCLYFDVPHQIQRTHPSVAASKQQNRALCENAMESSDYVAAEEAMRNNALPIQLYYRNKQSRRVTLDSVFQKTFEVLFFRIGTLWVAIPMIALLLLHEISNTQRFKALLQVVFRSNPDLEVTVADANVLIGGVNMVLTQAWVVFCSYFFYLRDRQIRKCVLLSGHWYTFCETLLAGGMVVGYLYLATSTPYNSKRNYLAVDAQTVNWYLAYIVVYVAITFRIFVGSMEFFHDSFESAEGIKSAMIVFIPSILLGLYVLYQSYNWKSEDIEKQLGRIPNEYDYGLKTGDICRVVHAHEKQSKHEISIAKDEKVIVLGVPVDGWAYIKLKDKQSSTGYAPAVVLEKIIENEQKDSSQKDEQSTEQLTEKSLATSSPVAAKQKVSSPLLQEMDRNIISSSKADFSESPSSNTKEKPSLPTRRVPINFLSEIKQGVKLKADKPDVGMDGQPATKSRSTKTNNTRKEQGGINLMDALKQKLNERNKVLREDLNESTDNDDEEWKD